MESTHKEKRAAPMMRRPRSVSQSIGPVQHAQRTEIHNILHSTGAQAKLAIGQPNDKYEQEADRVADRVMSMSDAFVAQRVETGHIQPMQIQRLCPECEEKTAQQEPEEEDEQFQTKEMPGQTPQVSSATESRINNLKCGGQPLDSATRSFFEPRFGHDFSHVRVHSDSAGSEIARSINARAFTLGKHVVMGAHEYQPYLQSGQCLLGHELAHVIQQDGGRSSSNVKPQRPISSDPMGNIIRCQAAVDRRARRSLERGDDYFVNRRDISVIFRNTSDAFINAVAYELRHIIVFRTDHGQFARQMVRALPDLGSIHSELLAEGITFGDRVRLRVYIMRREAPQPEQRWIMAIRFSIPILDEREGENVPVEQPTPYDRGIRAIRRADRLGRRLTMHRMHLVYCLTTNAVRFGYPEWNNNVYYLNPFAAKLFIQMSENDRREVLSGGVPPQSYKKFPIQMIADIRPDAPDAVFLEQLNVISEEIRLSKQRFDVTAASGSNIFGPNFYLLRDWVVSQQMNPHSPYYCDSH